MSLASVPEATEKVSDVLVLKSFIALVSCMVDLLRGTRELIEGGSLWWGERIKERRQESASFCSE